VYRPRVTNSQYKEHAGFVAETPRLKSLLQQKGVQTVADESYTFGDTDFGGQLSKMLRANPDVLNIRGYPADVSRAIKQAREQGYKGLIITNSGTTATEVKDAQAAGAMGNVIDIFAPLPSDQIKLGINTGPSKQFLNSFQSRYHTEPGGTSASAYDGLRILAAALAKSGDPTDVAKVKKALDGLTMSDVPGLVTSFKPQPGDRLFNARQSYFTVVGRTWSSQKDDWQASTAI
jgi:branched-chain amino acid transport system substrate-binding protein